MSAAGGALQGKRPALILRTGSAAARDRRPMRIAWTARVGGWACSSPGAWSQFGPMAKIGLEKMLPLLWWTPAHWAKRVLAEPLVLLNDHA